MHSVKDKVYDSLAAYTEELVYIKTGIPNCTRIGRNLSAQVWNSVANQCRDTFRSHLFDYYQSHIFNYDITNKNTVENEQ